MPRRRNSSGQLRSSFPFHLLDCSIYSGIFMDTMSMIYAGISICYRERITPPGRRKSILGIQGTCKMSVL